MKRLIVGAIVGLLLPATLVAQQKLGYIDSEFILTNVPEYATVEQTLDREATEWRQELDGRKTEIEEAFREYQSRELLYTEEERNDKREEILRLEDEMEQFRMRHFGPEGELFKRQEQLMRPIQEKILEAVEEVATSEGYDYVFDKASETLFLYYRDQHDLSIQVLEEMGIDTERISTAGQ